MKKMLLLFTFITVLVMTATDAAAEEPETNVSVRVNAPESISGTFEVTIDVEDVTNLDSGEFDLSFDPDVVSFVDVESGSIDDTEVPIAMWRLMVDSRVRVTFNLPGADVVSGSGYVARIIFEVVGAQGDVSVMDISKGLLVKPNPGTSIHHSDSASKIPANWFNDTVTIGDTTQAAPITRSTPRPTPDVTLDRSLDPTQKPTTALVVPEVLSVADSAIECEKDEPDDIELLTTQNCIYLYTLIGLFAFIYAFTLLR